MATFTIKEGDTSPAILYTLSPSDISLVGATVVFNMADRRGNLKINRGAATIIDDGSATDTPTVRYAWQSGDTDASGVYLAEFEVTYSDNTVESFPNGDFIIIDVLEDLG